VTVWRLKCGRCSRERDFDVGFNLALFEGRIFLYCPNCKSNTVHEILGIVDDETGEFIELERLMRSARQSWGEVAD